MPEQQTGAPTNPEQLAAVEAARDYIANQAPTFPRLFNIDGLSISVGKKWATQYGSDGSVEMTVDPGFFVEQDYKPEWAAYATIHEVTAHIREALWEPALTKRVLELKDRGAAESIFHNIMSDIAGNKITHARLPRLEETAVDLYAHKLFRDDPLPIDNPTEQQKRYRDEPRHLQFLYKIIRQEMIPDSFTVVAPEVDAAIARLRNYQQSGQDVIKYSTDVVKPDGSATKPEERFGLWLTVVYPEFVKLLEQDQQDKKSQQQSGDGGQPTDGQPDDGGQDPSDGQFSEDYQDYWQNRHPESLSEEQHEVLHKAAAKQSEDKRNTPNPEQVRQQKFEQETGHKLREQQKYNQELKKYLPQIEAMRELFFSRIIEPQVTIKRRLGHTPLTEGAILDPTRLAQTIVDIKTGNDEPTAFVDYEHRRTTAETVGNTDYYLVVDRSSSMNEDGKNKAASASTLIFLEGLAGIQTDIEEAEAKYGVDLDVSIRSSVYGFGDSAQQLKPLGQELNTKQRLDSYQAALNPLGEGTADYLALKAINDEPRQDDNRRRIVVVLTDGVSNDAGLASTTIQQLRGSANTSVYAISIGSNAAVNLYSPDAQRCDDPLELPNVLGKLLEETIA